MINTYIKVNCILGIIYLPETKNRSSRVISDLFQNKGWNTAIGLIETTERDKSSSDLASKFDESHYIPDIQILR